MYSHNKVFILINISFLILYQCILNYLNDNWP